MCCIYITFLHFEAGEKLHRPDLMETFSSTTAAACRVFRVRLYSKWIWGHFYCKSRGQPIR